MKLASVSFPSWVVIVLLVLAYSCHTEHPTDIGLERNFADREADFDKLLRMFDEDAGMSRITPKAMQASDGARRPDSEVKLRKQRWQEYRALFSELGIDHGIVRASHPAWRDVSPPGAVFLVASGKGMVGGSAEKGYAYSPTEPSPLVDSLDRINIDLRDKDMVPVYKKLKGDWYLFYREGG